MREMKDSGVDSIGKVPNAWRQRRLKYLCRVQTGNEDTQNANPDGQYPFYVRSPIQERCDRYTFDGEGILVAGDGAGAGRIFHHAYGKYAVHQRVYRLSEFYFSSRFLYYWLSLLFPYEMDKGSAQSTVPSMRLPMLLNFPVFLPPVNETLAIAAFLDEKCEEIDGLVEDIQAEVSTLEDYKKSIICETVTKGLNPDAELKDSGIAWVGECPEHWKKVKFKYHFKRRTVKNPGDVPVLSLYREYGVIPKDSRDDNHNVTSEDTSKYLFVRNGDFVINKMKAWQGSVAVSELEGIVSPAYYVYEFIGSSLHRKYIHYFMRNKSLAAEFRRLSGGIREGQWDLAAASLENCFICIPPLSEQHVIADYLDAKCGEIAATIAEKQKQLTTLEEYKKSLIYEYVTGKKEVPTP